MPPSAEHETARTLLSDPGYTDLDAVDRQLIELLQADGRIPYAELGRRANLTEKTARRRVSRLLDEGYMTIAAVTDPAVLGFGSMGLALLTVDGSRTPVDLAAELALLPEADYVTATTGPFGVVLELVCTDARELHDVAFGKIATLAGVRSVELLPYLRLHYQQARLSGALADSGVRPRPLDDTDRAILTRLALDGRAAFRDFASALGLSETTIRSRYSRMVDSGAARVMCIANPLRLGYRHSSWVAIRTDGRAGAQKVAEALTRVEAVLYVALTAGRWDVLAEVVTARGEDLLAVLDDSIRGLDGVTAMQAWPYLTVHYKAIHPR
ncbi:MULTISPECIES: Lrp/AsnC family transcriptional regulator [unclassified Mycolicibacterium]|uniref:Lrp/AsnC family transcriptional regulator n=1 Tax=unclassified Mycolicibacterium TaxID=2636767 RepID=UPI0012DEEF9D|nr:MULTISPECIES: AsnC family transcriptional regulator [unclassified Mycolicibacterium]MUL81839.1 Lrp/AsnC family transcriptional regulator [Mycolicibacterium sp. CBMA 329]MUL87605.1 Lrp/AsnC family transcriptional regulator [Mycolicibacterium sp. CBMA 331]MUL99531.1 Lrp/AsnC family transcriptional regulator [Mycolicibacterium sp. CBMA 334]MUM26549.1 Lrp/AsnC family transcriptional regulator [Mycolicibacterium sp. CBMA 295]MUM37902.1 Lrp/AsnC family transcriptional regulator [Mycolicibacterium